MALSLCRKGAMLIKNNGQSIKCDRCPCEDKPIYLRVTAKVKDPFFLETCFDSVSSSSLEEAVSELSTKISAPIYFTDTFICNGHITYFEVVAITVTVELFIDKNGERVLYDKASLTASGDSPGNSPFIYGLWFRITVKKINSGYTLNIDKTDS
jgi:hypothetical protein